LAKADRAVTAQKEPTSARNHRAEVGGSINLSQRKPRGLAGRSAAAAANGLATTSRLATAARIAAALTTQLGQQATFAAMVVARIAAARLATAGRFAATSRLATASGLTAAIATKLGQQAAFAAARIAGITTGHFTATGLAATAAAAELAQQASAGIGGAEGNQQHGSSQCRRKRSTKHQVVPPRKRDLCQSARRPIAAVIRMANLGGLRQSGRLNIQRYRRSPRPCLTSFRNQ